MNNGSEQQGVRRNWRQLVKMVPTIETCREASSRKRIKMKPLHYDPGGGGDKMHLCKASSEGMDKMEMYHLRLNKNRRRQFLLQTTSTRSSRTGSCNKRLIIILAREICLLLMISLNLSLSRAYESEATTSLPESATKPIVEQRKADLASHRKETIVARSIVDGLELGIRGTQGPWMAQSARLTTAADTSAGDQPLGLSTTFISASGPLAFFAHQPESGPASSHQKLSTLTSPSTSSSTSSGGSDNLISKCPQQQANNRFRIFAGQQTAPSMTTATIAASEVLAVEGTRIRLNLAVAGHRQVGGVSQRVPSSSSLSPASHHSQAGRPLRLHWTRDGSELSGQAAGGRLSSVQLASETSADSIRGLLGLPANDTATGNNNDMEQDTGFFLTGMDEQLATGAPSSGGDSGQPHAGQFHLFPYVNERLLGQLDKPQQQRQHLSATARQFISAALKSAVAGRSIATNNGRTNSQHQPFAGQSASLPVRDQFLGDGQSIDWRKLSAFLQTSRNSPPGQNGASPECVQASAGGHSELQHLTLLQVEINQLKLSDRGQYQLYVCHQQHQQTSSASPPLPAHHQSQAQAAPSSLPLKVVVPQQHKQHQQADCFQSQLLATVSLQVIEDVPRLETWFEPQILDQGDRLSIKCEATGFTLPQISWYLDGQLLSESSTPPPYVSRTGAGTGDDGSARSINQMSATDGDLIASSLNSNQNRLVGSSSSSSFPIGALGNQFRIGDYVSQDNHVHSFVNSSSIRLGDGGFYKCQANNGLHLVEHEARIDVRGPVNIQRPLANVSVLIGASQLHVQCPHSGYPAGSVEWLFKPLSRHQQQQQQSSASSFVSSAPFLSSQSGDYFAASQFTRSLRQKRRGSGAHSDQTSASQRRQSANYVMRDELAAAADVDETEFLLPGAYQQEPISDQEQDLDKDEWLSQASAMTPAPNSDDYPEPLPDYPVPVDELGASRLGSGRLSLTQAGNGGDFLFDSDEPEDYEDMQTNYQQQQTSVGRQQRLRRSAQTTTSEGHIDELSPTTASNWIKLPQSRRHQVHPNGTLTLHDIQLSDHGQYKCHVLSPGDSTRLAGAAEAEHSQNIAAVSSTSSVSFYNVEHKRLESMLGTWSNEMHLNTLVPPLISPFSSSETLREGMRNFLTCSVIEGDSPVKLAWLKDSRPIEDYIQDQQEADKLSSSSPAAIAAIGQRLGGGGARIKIDSSNEYTSTLSFSSVHFTDNGNYTCMATNKAASVNYTARMLVNVAPKWTKNPKDMECVAGQNIVIDCQADAHPNPRIWWEVGISSHVDSTKSNTGSGGGAASGSDTSLQAQQQMLQADQAASIQQHRPRHQHEQAPNHYRTIISNSRIHILENASLVIRDVSKQDQGYYLCQAANNFGSLSALIKLTVNVGASFQQGKYMVKYVKLNERVELDCDPSGQSPVTVTWYTRQQQHPPLAIGNQLNKTQQQQHLAFLNDGASGLLPAGHFEAGANQSSPAMPSNHHGYYYLSHQQQHQIQSTNNGRAPDTMASSLGRRRLFSATIQALEQAPGPQDQQQPHHQSNLLHADEGQSTDGANSSGNNNNNNYDRQQSHQSKLIEIDSSLSFEILKRFIGVQQPGKHQQHAHQQAQSYELVRLHIKQAKRSHSGEFVCHAANQFGADEKLVKLLVQEPPDPVREISALHVDSRSVSIAWQPPYNGNSPIVSYTVEWAPADQLADTESSVANSIDSSSQQQQQQRQQLGSGTHEAVQWSRAIAQQPALTIGSLKPMTSYEIRVSAHNQLGRSSLVQQHQHQHQQSAASSQPPGRFVVTTSEEAPTTPPGDIKAIPMSSTSLQVTWLPHMHLYATSGQSSASKDLPSSGGPANRQQQQQQQQHQHQLSLDSKQEEALTRQLMSIKGYYLGYKVANTNESYMFRTVPLYSANTNQQQLHGRAPNHDLILSDNMYSSNRGGDNYVHHQSYRPVFRQAADSKTSAGTVAQLNPAEQPHRLRVLIGDLKRSTKYSIIVQAYNSAGPGPQSDPIEARTLLNDPPPAPALRVGVTTHTGIELQWSFPAADSSAGEPFAALADQLQQVDIIPTNIGASVSSSTGDELARLESLDSIKQMARSSSAPLSSPSARQLVSATTSTQLPSGGSQQQVAGEGPLTDQQQPAPPIIDGYHLYYRQADLEGNGAWLERRLSPNSHSIVATGSGGNQLVRSSTEQLLPTVELLNHQDVGRSATSGPSKSVTELLGSSETGGNKQHQTAAAATAAPLNLSWLAFYGSNASLSHKTFHYLLDELACGQLYQIYLVAYNSYGSGLPSQIIRAKTRGSAPLAPDRQKDFIQANSTLVRLNLFSWHDSGCSLANFEIKYKQLSGRQEAISMLSSAAASAGSGQRHHQQAAAGGGVRETQQLASDDVSNGWLMLSNNISPEQRSIEVRDLRPETWYGLWVLAESSAGKTEAQYAFMTLDRLGQVPADAIEPLPVPNGGANQPALFRSGSSAGPSTIRSLLFNLSGSSVSPGNPNSLMVVSPLVVSTCMCLVVFATCSLFLIKRYNNTIKDSHGPGPAEANTLSRNTATACDRSGGSGAFTAPVRGHQFNGPSSDSSSPMPPAYLDGDEHAHHFHQTKFYRLTENDGYGGPNGHSSPLPSSFGQHQQQHLQEYYSMKMSPCKKGTTIITNSSSSTNDSSALLLNGSSASSSGGGTGGGVLGDPNGSSICDSATVAAAYGLIASAAHEQQTGQLPARQPGSGEYLHQSDCAASEQQLAPQVMSMAQLNQLLSASGNSAGGHHQQQICSQQNCLANALNGGKFATLARASVGQDSDQHHHYHQQHNLSTEGSSCDGLNQLVGPASQMGAFKTLPHQAMRPLSTFLPPNSSQYHQQNRLICAAGTGQQAASDYQQQLQIAEQQQIYSKLRLLQHYDAAMVAAGNYNLSVCQQQQQQHLQQESAVSAGQSRLLSQDKSLALSQDKSLALSQIYNGHNNSSADANSDCTTATSNLVQQQTLDLASNSQQQAQKSNQQQASNLSEQDDYALPFTPRWV